jgi:hypothetical protein
MPLSVRRDLGCPSCPKRLHYVTRRTADGTVHHKGDMTGHVPEVQVYECASHGRFHMGPDGRLKAGG